VFDGAGGRRGGDPVLDGPVPANERSEYWTVQYSAGVWVEAAGDRAGLFLGGSPFDGVDSVNSFKSES
jgi:hypothetical protein